MNDFSVRFNSILSEAYHNLLLMEETKRKYSSASFSFRDRNAVAHLIRNADGLPIGELADYLKISRPSATTLVKKLERYGLVERVADPKNNRSTIVKVTRKGISFSHYQTSYRNMMAEVVTEGFNDEEREVLYKGFCKLNDFFIKSINESEEIHKETR